MPKRLTRERIEQIREEIRSRKWESQPSPPLVRMLLSCGHEEDVPPGLDPIKAICGQCRQKSMRCQFPSP